MNLSYWRYYGMGKVKGKAKKEIAAAFGLAMTCGGCMAIRTTPTLRPSLLQKEGSYFNSNPCPQVAGLNDLDALLCSVLDSVDPSTSLRVTLGEHRESLNFRLPRLPAVGSQ